MNGFVVCSHASLLECLREGRVSVACPGDIFSSSAVLYSEDSLSDHFASIGPDNVDSEDLISGGVSEDLHQTFALVVGTCAGVSHEGENTLAVLDTGRLKLFLSLANGCNLGVGIDHTWDSIVVDMTSFANNVLNTSDTFLLSLVGKHGTSDNITDGPDAWDLCLEVIVDLNSAVFVSDKTSLFKLKSLSEGTTASSDEDNITIKSLASTTLGRLDLYLASVSATLASDDLSFHQELKALLFEDLLE